MKRCTRCESEQPLDQFCKDRSRRDGLSAHCRTCRNATYNAWRKKNPESVARAQKKWREANGDRARELQRQWREAHPGYSAEANRRWREANPEGQREHYRANLDQYRERNLRRRARKLAATVGDVDLEALWAKNEGRCQLCGEPIDRSLKGPHPMSGSVDHIVPLSKGGTHEQSNLQWTHLVENKRKGASVPSSTPFQGASE